MLLKSIDFTLVESEPSRQFQLFIHEAYSDLGLCMKIGQRFAVLVYLLINDGFLTTLGLNVNLKTMMFVAV